MRLAVLDRTGDLGEQARARAEARLSRFPAILDAVYETELEVTREAGRSAEPVHVVEIGVSFREPELASIRVRERGRELGKALEVAIDHAEFEVAELKERLTEHRHHG